MKEPKVVLLMLWSLKSTKVRFRGMIWSKNQRRKNQEEDQVGPNMPINNHAHRNTLFIKIYLRGIARITEDELFKFIRADFFYRQRSTCGALFPLKFIRLPLGSAPKVTPRLRLWSAIVALRSYRTRRKVQQCMVMHLFTAW